MGAKKSRKFLTTYFSLLLGSRIAYWYVFMVSGEFGLEREGIEKAVIEGMPFIAPEALSSADRSETRKLFAAVAHQQTEDAWAKVDEWVAGLYGLSSRDVQVINDTLEMGLPFAANRKRASAPADNRDLAAFQSALQEELAPWGERLDRRFVVKVQQAYGPMDPWRIMTISGGHADVLQNPDEDREILRLADRVAATEIIHHDEDHDRLWLARLNQKRYWTRSQSRLVARRIIWEHTAFLRGRGHA